MNLKYDNSFFLSLYNNSYWLNPVDQKKNLCWIRKASGHCDYPIKRVLRKLVGFLMGTEKGKVVYNICLVILSYVGLWSV